jgi:hypothetical protein
LVKRKKSVHIQNRKARYGTFWDEIGKPILKCIPFIILLLGVYAFIFDPLIPGKEVEGILENAYKQESQYGRAPLEFVVKLDSGEYINTKSPPAVGFAKGKRVILHEMTGKFFKRKKYRFLRFEEIATSQKDRDDSPITIVE